MKDELTDEHKLKQHLDRYNVRIPTKQLRAKQTMWQRFIRYLASPAQDPLEKLLDTVSGLRGAWFLPIAGGVFLTTVQLVVWLAN